MKNVKMTVDSNLLTVTVDLSVPGDLSKSGKSLILASTEGNKDVPGASGVKIGLNVYKPAK